MIVRENETVIYETCGSREAVTNVEVEEEGD